MNPRDDEKEYGQACRGWWSGNVREVVKQIPGGEVRIIVHGRNLI